MATAHKILRIVFTMLRNGKPSSWHPKLLSGLAGKARETSA